MGRTQYILTNLAKNKTDLAKTIEIKTVVVGSTTVGKSTLVHRLIFDKFTENMSSTIGAAFSTFMITEEENIYKFQIWDTAGQERFKSLIPMYMRKAQIVLLVFDITSLFSFDEVKNHWYDFIIKTEPDVKIILVGNKADNYNIRQVTKFSIDEFVEKKDIHYVECSAKNGDNMIDLENVMLMMARNVSNIVNNNNIIIPEEDIITSTGCFSQRCVF